MVAEQTKGIDARFFCGIPDVSELPGAYKNAAAVRRQIAEFGLAEIVDTIEPIGSIMAGDWQRDAPWRKKKAGQANSAAGWQCRSLRQRRGAIAAAAAGAAPGRSSSPFRPRPSTASVPMPPTAARWRRSSRPRAGPRFNPLIVHVPDVDAGRALARARRRSAAQLAAAFWPGAADAGAGQARRAAPSPIWRPPASTPLRVRVPAHPVAQALLRAADLPIAAPSANRSGHVSPTTAAHVEADLGDRVAMILDGGATPVGLESTVVDVTGDEPVILRLGGVAARGHRSACWAGRSPLADGEPASRPRPACWPATTRPRPRLRLDAREVQRRRGAAGLRRQRARRMRARCSTSARPATSPRPPPTCSPPCARSTRRARRPLPSCRSPSEGLGEAINDRLRRAARADMKTPQDRQP